MSTKITTAKTLLAILPEIDMYSGALQKSINDMALNSTEVNDALALCDRIIDRIYEHDNLVKLKQNIEELIASLDDKEILLLYYVHGKPLAKIAETYCISPRTASRRLALAVKEFTAKLSTVISNADFEKLMERNPWIRNAHARCTV